MCNCLTMCRTFEETEDGRWPISNHAPRCEDYETKKYIVLSYDGSRCVMEPADAEDMMKDSENGGIEPYGMEEVFITQDQFEKLDEFDGF